MNYEKVLDQVDKLSLKGKYNEAKKLVDVYYPQLFEPVAWYNLNKLIETNAAKRGEKA